MTTQMAELSRAKRLRALTHSTHEALDQSIMSAASFDTVEGYARFVEVQYLFHRDINALYREASVQALITDIGLRCRLDLIVADLTDLGRALPETSEAPVFTSGAVDLPTALGWLYVAEGSNMGAALLRKEAAKLGLSDSFGARHLAPAAEGPAAHWRSFTGALDGASLSPAEEARVVEGAQAAFARVQAFASSRLAGTRFG